MVKKGTKNSQKMAILGRSSNHEKKVLSKNSRSCYA